MQWAIYLPLAVPLCAAAGARAVASRLPPQVATWLLTLAAVALAALSTAVLGLLACTAFLRIPLVATLGHMSVRAIRHNDPASLFAAVGGTLLLTVAVTQPSSVSAPVLGLRVNSTSTPRKAAA